MRESMQEDPMVEEGVPQEDPMVEEGVPQEEPMVEEGGLPTEQQELSKQDKAYLSGLMKLLHGKKTAPTIEKMLQGGPPAKTIPAAALEVNGMFEKEVRGKGKPPSLDLLFNVAIFLVSDLIEIGNAAGHFQIETEEEVGAILQDTMKSYIQKGLKDGTIDPVELQQKVEPLMSEEDRAGGLALAEQDGLPGEPNEHTAMEVYADRKVRKQGMLKGGGA